MDLFRVPGANLAPSSYDKIKFDEIKPIFDRCTNDILSRPDWESNIQFVDAVNSINTTELRNEVIFLVRKKFSSSNPKVVFLAITLAEAVVKNGGPRVHAAVGTDAFMKELAKVARKYSGKRGGDSIEVAELSLDVIQAWGEAFLSHQKQFPAYVKIYHELRKEGMQFKPQYDINRVPIFTPTGGGFGESGEDSGILKAAMAASMDSRDDDSIHNSLHERQGRSVGRNDHGVGRNDHGASASAELLESMVTSLGILCEIITASTSSQELTDNELASEVALQLRNFQNGLGAAIEYELAHDPEGTELLFKMNDDSQMILAVYEGVIDRTTTLQQALEIVRILGAGDPHMSLPSESTSSSASGKGPDLLDFLDSISFSDTPQSDLSSFGETAGNFALPAVPVVPNSAPQSFFPITSSASAAAPINSFDPFGNDPDPFGNTSSIDDLLASPPIDNNTSLEMLSSSSMYTPQPLLPAGIQQPIEHNQSFQSKNSIDLDALLNQGNNNQGGFPYQGQGSQGMSGLGQPQYSMQPPQQYQQQQQYQQPPQAPQQQGYPYNNQPQQQYQQQPQQQAQYAYNNQHPVSPSGQYNNVPYNNTIPHQLPPPTPSSPPSFPPPVPQQQNPFDTF